MTLPRVVEPEVLDGLAEHDPAAQRARRDLRRVHRVMGTRRILLKGWQAALPRGRQPGLTPLRVLELGAGDGSLLLGVARALRRPEPAASPAVHLTLLDRQKLLTPALVADYAACGWQCEALVTDVLDWAAAKPDATTPPSGPPRWDLIVANLFLHHFESAALARLLQAVGARCDRFLAVEPRRSRVALAGSRLIGALGVNAVTRADAVASVRAGFTGEELRAVWPDDLPGWTLHEAAAGPFSHCLLALREQPGAKRADSNADAH